MQTLLEVPFFFFDLQNEQIKEHNSTWTNLYTKTSLCYKVSYEESLSNYLHRNLKQESHKHKERLFWEPRRVSLLWQIKYINRKDFT